MIHHVTFGYLIHDELLSYKDAAISGARYHFRRLLWRQCLHMRNW